MNYPCLWPPAKDWSSSGGLFFLNLPLPHTGAPRPFSSPFSLCLARCPGVSYTCGQASTPPWPLSKAETLFRAQWSCRYSGQPLAQPHEMAASTLLGPRLSHCLNQPPSSVLLNSPSHSFKCAFSFLSPYDSPQTAVNPSLGTLRAHSV